MIMLGTSGRPRASVRPLPDWRRGGRHGFAGPRGGAPTAAVAHSQRLLPSLFFILVSDQDRSGDAYGVVGFYPTPAGLTPRAGWLVGGRQGRQGKAAALPCARFPAHIAHFGGGRCSSWVCLYDSISSH